MKLNKGPREKLEELGIESLSDEEVLALLIKTGTKNENVLELSKRILDDISPIEMLFEYSFEELMQFKGIGKAKAMTIISALELTRRINKRKSDLKVVRTLNDEISYLYMDFKDLYKEKAIILYLSYDYRVLSKQEFTEGGFDRISINSKEILKRCIRINCGFVVLAHNHPSQNPSPSFDDEKVFDDMEIMLSQFGITLLDSIIFSNETYFSMKYNYQVESVKFKN